MFWFVNSIQKLKFWYICFPFKKLVVVVVGGGDTHTLTVAVTQKKSNVCGHFISKEELTNIIRTSFIFIFACSS